MQSEPVWAEQLQEKVLRGLLDRLALSEASAYAGHSIQPSTTTTSLAVQRVLCQNCNSRSVNVGYDFCSRSCGRAWLSRGSVALYRHSTAGLQYGNVSLLPLCQKCGVNPVSVKADGTLHSHCSRGCAMAASATQQQNLAMCKMCDVRRVYVSNGVPFEFCSRTCGLAFRNQHPHSAQPLSRSSFFSPASYRKSAPAFFASTGRPLILFYDKNRPHYSFTNFAEYPVVYNGERYPTSEHLFQSFKFEHIPDLVKKIRLLPTARQAFDVARNHNQDKRRDWDLVKVGKMEEIVYLKFTQHPALKTELLATGNAELVEDSPYDSFWGMGQNGMGRNELGKALMKVRDRLLAGN